MYFGQASAPSGYDEYFDPPLEEDHECPICLSGLREPMQTSCGHRFCRECILWSFRYVSHSCPVDNERLDENSLYPDNFAKREILCHDVFCRMKKEHGCTWKGPLKTLDDHMKVCVFVDICCPKNCGKQLQRKNAKQHLENECPNRTTRCEHCGKEVHWNGLEKHFRTCQNFRAISLLEFVSKRPVFGKCESCLPKGQAGIQVFLGDLLKEKTNILHQIPVVKN